uniref:Uncharacterized protein n=1 Tax=Oryza glumipatula TaxID=40148 RepID=A0A0E0BH00_9ORYZ
MARFSQVHLGRVNAQQRGRGPTSARRRRPPIASTAFFTASVFWGLRWPPLANQIRPGAPPAGEAGCAAASGQIRLIEEPEFLQGEKIFNAHRDSLQTWHW